MVRELFLCCIGFITLYIITQKLFEKKKKEKMRIKEKKSCRPKVVSRNETSRTHARVRPNRELKEKGYELHNFTLT